MFPEVADAAVVTVPPGVNVLPVQTRSLCPAVTLSAPAFEVNGMFALSSASYCPRLALVIDVPSSSLTVTLPCITCRPVKSPLPTARVMVADWLADVAVSTKTETTAPEERPVTPVILYAPVFSVQATGVPERVPLTATLSVRLVAEQSKAVEAASSV